MTIERVGDYTGTAQFGVLRRHPNSGVAAAHLIQPCGSLDVAIKASVEVAKFGPPVPGLRDRQGQWHFLEDLAPALQWIRAEKSEWGRRYDDYGGKHTRLLPPSGEYHPNPPLARETLYYDAISWWLVVEEAWGDPERPDPVECRSYMAAMDSSELEALEARAKWRVDRCYQYTADNGRGWAQGRGLGEELAMAAAIESMVGVFSVFGQTGEPGKTTDGGSYDFWRTYVRTDTGGYEIEHRTSADFPYCPVRGRFEECEQCPNYDSEDRECYADNEVITAEEAVALYASAKSAGTLLMRD